MTARIKGNILTIDGVKTRLTPFEVIVLWAVMARQHVTIDDLMEMLWPHPDDMPDWWRSVIGKIMCDLRAKLRPSGWGIKKRHSKPIELVRIIS